MKNFKQLIEYTKNDTIIFFFGNCNPPTISHVLTFGMVVKTAKNLGADYNIIISRAQDDKNNFLSITQKLEYLNIQYPDVKYTVAHDNIKTAFDAIKIFDKKYKNIVMITGSNSIEYFQKALNTYNGKDYNFKSIRVISSGEPDPDTNQISANIIKDAKSGNYDKFKRGLMAHVRDIDGKRMMNDMRINIGLPKISESIQFDRVDIREKYRNGELFKEDTFVESDSVIYKIINRNNNYLTLVNESGIITKKWLTDVSEIIPDEKVITKFGEISEMKFNSSDKLKVAKIIGSALGADIEKSANPEQIVNAGLKLARSKALNDEAKSILQKMLQTADNAGIKYNKSILDKKIEEATLGRDEDYDEYIERSAKESHAKGQRFITFAKSDQYKADLAHAELNRKGGPQVELPQGMSRLPPNEHVRIAQIHRHTTESTEVNPSEDMEISDEDIEQMIASFKDEFDILDAYEDDELHLVDQETGESTGSIAELPSEHKPVVDEIPDSEKDPTKYSKDIKNESIINEVLTRLDRINAGIRMRIKHPTMERKLKLALVKHSNTAKLAHRARVLAIKTIKLRIMRKPLDQFTVQDKERAEKMIQSRKAIIGRIAMRLMPKIRKIEQTRLSHPNFTKEQN